MSGDGKPTPVRLALASCLAITDLYTVMVSLSVSLTGLRDANIVGKTFLRVSVRMFPEKGH